MGIALIHEDDYDMAWAECFGADQLLEHCHFCEKPTRFWAPLGNTPVCPRCARTRSWRELPNRLAYRTEAYAAIRRMTPRQITLRERDDDLEQIQIKLMEARAQASELAEIRLRRLTVQKKLMRMGLPIRRPA